MSNKKLLEETLRVLSHFEEPNKRTPLDSLRQKIEKHLANKVKVKTIRSMHTGPNMLPGEIYELEIDDEIIPLHSDDPGFIAAIALDHLGYNVEYEFRDEAYPNSVNNWGPDDFEKYK